MRPTHSLVFLVCSLFLTSAHADVKRSDDVLLTQLQTTVLQQAATIQQLQSRLTALENAQPSTFKQVAFTASLTNDILNLGPNEIVKFDHVVTNVGGGYSPLTGVFTAPVSGLYTFSLSFMSIQSHDHIYLAIDNEGTVLGAGFADGSADWDQGSVQASAHVSQGQRVYVRQEVHGTAVRGGYNSHHTTVFSGVLVQADH